MGSDDGVVSICASHGAHKTDWSDDNFGCRHAHTNKFYVPVMINQVYDSDLIYP